LVLVLAGCTAPSVTGVIQDEPVCPDFTVGAPGTKMKGSLKQPVQVSILDGSSVRWQRTLLGRRTAAAPHSRFVVEDDDDTYTVQWAQCPNAFAPKRAELGKTRAADHVPTYDCGESKVYKKEKLEIRQGDASSRVLHWAPPPAPACWSNLAPEPSASASASAGEPAPSASASATADDPPPSSEASSKASIPPATSASAPPHHSTARPTTPPPARASAVASAPPP